MTTKHALGVDGDEVASAANRVVTWTHIYGC